VFSVPLRGDKVNGVNRGMNFIRPVKDIEAMEIEMYILIYISAEAERGALVDVRGTNFTRTGGKSVACTQLTEKVLFALNMLCRICVLWYLQTVNGSLINETEIL